MSTDGAQLETENTQDNFLYEMILLLIENNKLIFKYNRGD